MAALLCLALVCIPVAAWFSFRFGVTCGVDAAFETVKKEIERKYTLIPKIRERV